MPEFIGKYNFLRKIYGGPIVSQKTLARAKFSTKIFAEPEEKFVRKTLVRSKKRDGL